jgi:beta-lactamase regulating signal transducer with metallopeptidase domain
MSSFFSFLALYAVNALWQIPLVTAAGWMVCQLIRRLGPLAQHRVWLITLVTCIGLPLCHIASGSLWSRTLSSRSALALVEASSGHMPVVHRSFALLLPAGIVDAIAGLYLLLFFYFLLRFLIAVHSTNRLVENATPVSLTPEFAVAWQDAKGAFGLSDVCMLTSSAVTGPVTVSARTSFLLLPDNFMNNTSAEDFRVAVAHECAHLRRKDFFKNLFSEATSLFIAFHPVTWLLKAQLSQTREMTCDAMAAEAIGDSRVYIHALLRLAQATSSGPALTIHAIGIFDAHILEERIMVLRAQKKRTSIPAKLCFILAGGLCLIVVTVGAARAAVSLGTAKSGSANASQQDEKVYKVGTDVTAPRVLDAPPPDYPKNLPVTGVTQGNCLISLTVDAAGLPRDVHVVRSLSKDFDDKAVESVLRYRFAPGMRAGVPVAVALIIEVTFQKF